MTISGVIFDFGGVIHNMRWDIARQIELEQDLEQNTLLRTLYDCDEWREVERGRGDIEGWRAIAQQRLDQVAGRPLPPLHKQWRDSWHLIDENVALVRALRPPYKLAILSNADITLEDRLRSGLNIHNLFDVVVCSAAVGMAKPEPAIYGIAAERLRLRNEECVSIDDSPGNVEAARMVGMLGIHYRVHKGDNLAAQLAELGVQPLTH